MPIRRELKALYPRNWRRLSHRVRFVRAKGSCERCGRPHGRVVRGLPDRRWFDEGSGLWRDGKGRPTRGPDLVQLTRLKTTGGLGGAFAVLERCGNSFGIPRTSRSR